MGRVLPCFLSHVSDMYTTRYRGIGSIDPTPNLRVHLWLNQKETEVTEVGVYPESQGRLTQGQGWVPGLTSRARFFLVPPTTDPYYLLLEETVTKSRHVAFMKSPLNGDRRRQFRDSPLRRSGPHLGDLIARALPVSSCAHSHCHARCLWETGLWSASRPGQD